jgi:hypothetical protein
MMKRIHTPLFGSLHRLTNFNISIEDANTVLSSTYVDAILVGGTESDKIVYRDNGIYHDRFERRNGAWGIASRRYERVWRESTTGVSIVAATANPLGKSDVNLGS